MDHLPLVAGLATGAAVLGIAGLWSLHVRDYHPEQYRGAIRIVGSLVRTRGFVIGYSATMIVLAVGSAILGF